MNIKRSISIFITVLLLLLCFTSCDGINGSNSTAKCDHEYSTETVSPGWRTPGGDKYTCKKCGRTYMENKIDCYIDQCEKVVDKMYSKIKSNLKDPYSAVFKTSLYAEKMSISPDTYTLWFLVQYNAKNSYGAYTGYQMVAFYGHIDYGILEYVDYSGKTVTNTDWLKSYSYICDL